MIMQELEANFIEELNLGEADLPECYLASKQLGEGRGDGPALKA